MSSTGRNTFLTRIALVAAFAAGTLSMGGAEAAGVTDTKHNLSSGSTQANRVTGSGATGTDEICVFCHTPHGGSNVLGAPLWNKNLPAGTGYNMYSSTTMDGAAPSSSLAGSASLVCLSCHDGTQAMDNIINAPGSGGLTNGGGATGLGYTWAAGGTTDADGRLTTASVANLGVDLRNDHPIGIPYCGGGLSGAAAVVSGTCADADFKTGATDVKTAPIGGLQVFWVDTSAGSPGTRQRTDIQLYSRTGETSPFVECGSCHDPHVDGTSGSGATFLRIANAGSAVCLACHVK